MNPRRVAFFYNNPSGLQPEEAELANILYLAWASATLLLNRRNCQTRGSAIFVFIMWWNKTREPGWCHPQPGRHRLPCKPPRLCYASPLGLATGDHFPPYGYIFLNKKTVCFGFISSNFQLVNKWPGNLVDASPNRGGTGYPASHKGSAIPALWVWQLGITFPPNGYIFLNKKTNLPWIYIRHFLCQQMTYES